MGEVPYLAACRRLLARWPLVGLRLARLALFGAAD
jgi:hypothetical protein